MGGRYGNFLELHSSTLKVLLSTAMWGDMLRDRVWFLIEIQEYDIDFLSDFVKTGPSTPSPSVYFTI